MIYREFNITMHKYTLMTPNPILTLYSKLKQGLMKISEKEINRDHMYVKTDKHWKLQKHKPNMREK